MNLRLVVTASAIAVVTATAGTATAITATSAGAASASRARPGVTTTVLPSFAVVSHASYLKVFNTSTGAAVGTLTVPAGQEFDGVASAGTSDTFLAYTNPASSTAACHAYYYSLQLSRAGKPSALKLLRSILGSAATAITANPGGGTYAYSAVHCDTAPNGLIGISGKRRTHTWSYDQGDDYTFSLAATTDAGTLALSLYAGSGWANLLLNTNSNAATVDGASRVVPTIPPYAQSLAISPSGATLYACISNGRTGELAAYDAKTGKMTQVLHSWTLGRAASYFCQVSADATGKFLIASYASDVSRHTSLIGINPLTGAAVKLPVEGDYTTDGIGAAW